MLVVMLLVVMVTRVQKSLQERCGLSLDLLWETHPSNHGGVLALAWVLLADCDIRTSWLDLTAGKVWREGSNDNVSFQNWNCLGVRQHGRVGTATGREFELVQQGEVSWF